LLLCRGSIHQLHWRHIHLPLGKRFLLLLLLLLLLLC
jgi:hypothetical protein